MCTALPEAWGDLYANSRSVLLASCEVDNFFLSLGNLTLSIPFLSLCNSFPWTGSFHSTFPFPNSFFLFVCSIHLCICFGFSVIFASSAPVKGIFLDLRFQKRLRYTCVFQERTLWTSRWLLAQNAKIEHAQM